MIRGIITLLLIILSTSSLNAGQKYNNQAGHFDITGEIPIGSVPDTPTSAGYKGLMQHDSTHLYMCIDTDTWKRIALSTWSTGSDVLLLSGGTDKLLLSDGTSNLLLKQ